MIAWLVPAAVFKTVVPVLNRELGSIPRRSRHLKKSVNANFLSYTGYRLKSYERIPVQFNTLESTLSLPIWSHFGSRSLNGFVTDDIHYNINLNPRIAVDDNVFLVGILYGGSLNGNWNWSTFIGITNGATFTPKR